MKSIIRSIAITSIFLFCAACFAQQINPATDVRWPTCASGQTYSPNGNHCVTTAAALPGVTSDGANGINVVGAVNAGTVKAATINDVVICPTSMTVAQCVALLPGTGGTVQLLAASYTAGFSSCMATANVTIQGEGVPQLNTGDTALIGGTIIKGTLPICASNVTLDTGGSDTGSSYIAGGGTPGDGFYFCTAGCTNPSDPFLQNATVKNWVSLNSSASALYHAGRIEHYNNVVVDNVTLVYGTHGLAAKGTNMHISQVYSYGHSTDCLITKSDAFTSASNIQIDQVSFGAIAVGDTTSGLLIDAEAAASVQNVHVSGLLSYGLPYGILFETNSSFGTGSISFVTISHAQIYQIHIPGLAPAWSSGIAFIGSSGSIEYSLLDDISIINGAGTDNNTPLLMQAGMNHSTISNVYTYNSNQSAALVGVFTIKNWEDSGSGSAPPTFTSSSSGTVVLVTGLNSYRGNLGYTTSGGAVIQVNPVSQDGSHAIVNYPLKGNGSAVQISGDTASGVDLLVDNGAENLISMKHVEGSGLMWGPGNSSASFTYISDSNKVCQSSGLNCPTGGSPTYTAVISGAYANNQTPTITTLGAAGSGGSFSAFVCQTGSTCTANYGSVQGTMGTTPTTGDLFKLAWTNLFNHKTVCTFQAVDGTSSAMFNNLIQDTGTSSSTTGTAATEVAPTAAHQYIVVYQCW